MLKSPQPPINAPLSLPKRIERLPELARNLWSVWEDAGLRLWRSVGEQRWEDAGHQAVALLTDTPPSEWLRLAADPGFLSCYDTAVRAWDDYRSRPSWFTRNYPELSGTAIAYFSAEFGIHESLPIYSGGLGVLAGDHLKSASDLGVPLIGVGLLYRKGYFEQRIDSAGRQIAEPVEYDFSRLPLSPAPGPDGSALVVEVPLPGRTLRLNVWQAEVGRIRVLLLDAERPDNAEADRGITARLYGGGPELRIAQETVLGIGGVRALRALGIRPELYHINEGHAALLSLERLRDATASGMAADTALELVRASTIFTTHTPVAAGHDVFPRETALPYLASALASGAFTAEQAFGLGQDDQNQFHLTYFAMNTSSRRNGVSHLHGRVSRDMFRPLHGGIAEEEVPIGHVTNGVHLESWTAPEMKELFDRFLPGTWREHHAQPIQWKGIELIPAASLWGVHQSLKERMIRFVRKCLREQAQRQGAGETAIAEAARALDPHALTIGFARRFASYKRAHLIFNDLPRLRRLVTDEQRPLQMIFAGKAHPDDAAGQELIRELYRVSQMEAFRGKIVLLENYDMNMARHLVQGVDVWLNNPRRPFEASGTSGQKAAMNGVLHLSVRDGWWAEAFREDIGWSIDGSDDATWEEQERQNTESLYSRLETELVPLYYNQGEVPVQWAERMKRSIMALSPAFSSQRMVEEYVREWYVPSLQQVRRFMDRGAAVAELVASFKRWIRESWHHVRIDRVNEPGIEPISANAFKPVEALVFLGPIDEKDVVVEAVWRSEGKLLARVLDAAGETGGKLFRFQGEVPADLLFGPHYTVRVRPLCPEFIHPFELSCHTQAP